MSGLIGWYSAPHQPRRIALVCAAFCALLIVPLLFSPIPPYVDLPDHIARFHIQNSIAHDPALRLHYSFQPAFIANLAVDLLIMPLGALIGVERAAWLLVALIPIIFVISVTLLCRAATGRLQPGLPVAFLFIFSRVFNYGLLNYFFTVALALACFAAWVMLQHRNGVRAALFLVLAPLMMLGHAAGWGTMALLIGGYELGRIGLPAPPRQVGRAVARAAVLLLPIALPIALLLIWRGQGDANHDATIVYAPIREKIGDVVTVLRDQNRLLDLGSFAFCAGIGGVALIAGARIGRAFLVPLVLLAFAYLALPQALMTAHMTDKRELPIVFMLFFALLDFRRVRPGIGAAILLAGAALLVARIAVLAIAHDRYRIAYDRTLAAIDHMRRGSRVYFLVNTGCKNATWQIPRNAHLPAIAVVRKQVWINQLYAIPGQQMIRVTYHPQPPRDDDSAYLGPSDCGTPQPGPDAAHAAARVPRSGIDYLWLIGVSVAERGAFERALPLRLVWQDGADALYAPLADRRRQPRRIAEEARLAHRHRNDAPFARDMPPHDVRQVD